MNFLRTWLVVLLAVLLPMRGAMGASMLCAPVDGFADAPVMGATHHEALPGHHGHAIADGHSAHDRLQHEHGKPATDHADHKKCNLCSSTCSSPPLSSATAKVDEPRALTAVSYPDLSAPAATFQSDGQERPPRTI